MPEPNESPSWDGWYWRPNEDAPFAGEEPTREAAIAATRTDGYSEVWLVPFRTVGADVLADEIVRVLDLDFVIERLHECDDWIDYLHDFEEGPRWLRKLGEANEDLWTPAIRSGVRMFLDRMELRTHKLGPSERVEIPRTSEDDAPLAPGEVAAWEGISWRWSRVGDDLVWWERPVRSSDETKEKWIRSTEEPAKLDEQARRWIEANGTPPSGAGVPDEAIRLD